MRSLLQRMVSGPLDEGRLDEVLNELVGYKATSPGTAKSPEEEFVGIDKRSLSRWMLSTYLNFLQDPSLVRDKVEDVEQYMQ